MKRNCKERNNLEKKQAEKAAKQAEKAAEKAAKQKDNSKLSRKRGASGRHVRDTSRKRMCRESEIVFSNECIVCLGDYSDDIDSETGKLLKEWIRCTKENFAVWMHVECADTSDENYVCCVCECIFC